MPAFSMLFFAANPQPVKKHRKLRISMHPLQCRPDQPNRRPISQEGAVNMSKSNIKGVPANVRISRPLQHGPAPVPATSRKLPMGKPPAPMTRPVEKGGPAIKR
jgi:hypothetical protein